MDTRIPTAKGDEELFSLRGLEAFVPALAALRRDAWWHLPARYRTALEIADYLGLEHALALTIAELDELRGIVPEPLRARCIALAECRGAVCPEQKVFQDETAVFDTGAMIHRLADAFAGSGSIDQC
jgi:hypothetical protein